MASGSHWLTCGWWWFWLWRGDQHSGALRRPAAVGGEAVASAGAHDAVATAAQALRLMCGTMAVEEQQAGRRCREGQERPGRLIEDCVSAGSRNRELLAAEVSWKTDRFECWVPAFCGKDARMEV